MLTEKKCMWNQSMYIDDVQACFGHTNINIPRLYKCLSVSSSIWNTVCSQTLNYQALSYCRRYNNTDFYLFISSEVCVSVCLRDTKLHGDNGNDPSGIPHIFKRSHNQSPIYISDLHGILARGKKRMEWNKMKEKKEEMNCVHSYEQFFIMILSFY